MSFGHAPMLARDVAARRESNDPAAVLASGDRIYWLRPPSRSQWRCAEARKVRGAMPVLRLNAVLQALGRRISRAGWRLVLRRGGPLEVVEHAGEVVGQMDPGRSANHDEDTLRLESMTGVTMVNGFTDMPDPRWAESDWPRNGPSIAIVDLGRPVSSSDWVVRPRDDGLLARRRTWAHPPRLCDKIAVAAFAVPSPRSRPAGQRRPRAATTMAA
jgi:hypothetical protein